MSIVLSTLGQFSIIVLVAVFVQNPIFTRALGISRLVYLVKDSSADNIIFISLLTLVQVLSAPLGYFVNQWLRRPEIWYRGYIRPLLLVLCAAAAFVVVLVGILLIQKPHKRELMAALPLATFNCAVLGPLLLVPTQAFSFVQTMAFALGSGLGYGLAVLLLQEGQRKMASRSVPAAFRGLPIDLIYIGILALAFYGLTGHRLAI